MKLENKRVAILIEKMYEDLEAWYPYYRLKEEGAEVYMVGPKKGERYPSRHDFLAKADISIREAKVEDFDAVIIPGGYSPDHMRRTPQMTEFIRNMHKAGKIVAAICHGGWMLASADIIRGKKVTGFFSIQDDLRNAGAEFIDREVVEDNGIITSRTPDDLPAFCKALINAISGKVLQVA